MNMEQIKIRMRVSTYCLRICGESGDDEKEGERCDELDEERLHGANRRHGGDGGGKVTIIQRVIERLGRERGSGGAEELRGDVRREVSRGELAEHGHGYTDSRVQMAAWHVAEGWYEHEQGEPRGGCHAEQAQRAVVSLVHDECWKHDEDEQECS